jgi:hypothetical protein
MGFKNTRTTLNFPWAVLADSSVIVKGRTGYEIATFGAAFKTAHLKFATDHPSITKNWKRVK